MKNEGMEFPHPVLNEVSNDYVDSSFSISVVDNSDNGSDLVLIVECRLNSPGLESLVSEGKASAIMRLACYRTSYRDVFALKINAENTIQIKKSKVADKLSLQAMIVANEDISHLQLKEFNPDFFGVTSFNIRKGDILAEEKGLRITLDTLIEQNLSGIVVVNHKNIQSTEVHYAAENEEDAVLVDYITITMPDELYKTYALLRERKYLKSGIERYLMASVVFPAIVGGIGLLRAEEEYELEDDAPHYRDTVWANSIYDSLLKRGYDDIGSNGMSDYELANLLLGDVVADSISNLKQKADDWTKIHEEDPDR